MPAGCPLVRGFLLSVAVGGGRGGEGGREGRGGEGGKGEIDKMMTLQNYKG